MKYIFLFVLLIILTTSKTLSQGQPNNTDPSKNYVNVNMPKTPESAGFERYGYAQVNEFTGTSSISIPIYSLKSRFLEMPITLSYQSTGIRVNQEASWVGLGFDLNVGGRITVETRGCADFSSYTKGLTTPDLQTTMGQVFRRLGNSRENAVLTPATFWDPPAPCQGCPVDTNLYNGNGIMQMTSYGAGQPDIFRANFMGHSVTYYVDAISKNINFIGEQSTFKISYTADSYNNITEWKLIDNDGVTYYFSQVETTTNTLPSSSIVPTTSTTSWLLTQILHPSGDYINFTYANYGSSVPAFSMAGDVDVQTSGGTIVSNDYNQNINIQSTYYLTRAESADIAVDFILGARTDLYGDGSRKLEQIKVTDKLSNKIRRTSTFNYSYFQATADNGIHNYLASLFYNLPSSMSVANYLASSTSRLRLDSVNVVENSYQPPYRFYYNGAITIPDKYSYAQDHWGYYNGVNNASNGYTFSHLVPLNGALGVQNQLPPSGYAFSPSTIGNSRECDATQMSAMMMDSVVYPTGGSSKFIYEPHQSTMIPTIAVTGGGLRVKTIKNYVSGSLLGSKEYAYTGGKYMGTINYFTTASVMSYCAADNPGSVGHWKYNSNAAVNANEILIGYNNITITEKDPNGNANGSLVKTFNTNTPQSYLSNGIGFDLVPPYLATGESYTNVQGYNYTTWLDATHKNLPPTPSANLEGKLMQEQYFDNLNNLLKSVNYYYHLGNYTNNFYDIKAIQNRVNGFNGTCGYGTSPNNGYNSGGWRPVNLFVSPAKSFFTLTDSIKEVTYQGTNAIVQKKSFTYDSKSQIRSETDYNSDNTITTISYTHPYDYLSTGVNGSTTLIYEMTGRNMNNTVFSTRVIKNGNQVDSVFNLYYLPSSGVIVPQNTQVQIANNPIETRQTYNAYDNFGHLLEKQKPNGPKEVYLWGYDAQFPVAYVVGSDYATVSGLVNSSILSNPSTDLALRTELNKIRAQLPNALVTTYTYDPIFGITSQTDARGKTSYFEYDGMGRLAVIRDQDNNIMKRLCYNYQGQVESCQYYYNTEKSGTFVRNNCGIGYAGGSATYTVPANTYGSAISQADADAKASADVNANGQTYANNTAPCYSACSFSMFSSYNSPSNSISSDGTTVSFYIVFYSSNTLQVNTSYGIATINGSCKPSTTRIINYTTGGRTWQITISNGGTMVWKIISGTALPANTTVSTSTLTYGL